MVLIFSQMLPVIFNMRDIELIRKCSFEFFDKNKKQNFQILKYYLLVNVCITFWTISYHF